MSNWKGKPLLNHGQNQEQRLPAQDKGQSQDIVPHHVAADKSYHDKMEEGASNTVGDEGDTVTHALLYASYDLLNSKTGRKAAGTLTFTYDLKTGALDMSPVLSVNDSNAIEFLIMIGKQLEKELAEAQQAQNEKGGQEPRNVGREEDA